MQFSKRWMQGSSRPSQSRWVRRCPFLSSLQVQVIWLVRQSFMKTDKAAPFNAWNVACQPARNKEQRSRLLFYPKCSWFFELSTVVAMEAVQFAGQLMIAGVHALLGKVFSRGSQSEPPCPWCSVLSMGHELKSCSYPVSIARGRFQILRAC